MMSIQESLFHLDSLIPLAIVISLGLLAIAGTKELLKEAATAFNKEASA